MAAEDHIYIRSWAFAWKSLGRSEATLQNMERELRGFALRLGRPLTTATRADCEEHITERLKVSQYQGNYCWRAMRSFYAYLVEEGEIERSPVERTRAPKVDEAPVRVVVDDDVLKLLDEAKRKGGFYGARDAAIVSTLWETGMRRSELAGMRCEDIDLEGGVIVLPKTKNRSVRYVPLSTSATKWIYKYERARAKHSKASLPQYWLGKFGPMSSDAIRQVMFELSRAAGIEVSAHDLRRTFAASYLADGGNETNLRTIVGWRTPSMTARYTRMVSSQIAIAEFRRLRG